MDESETKPDSTENNGQESVSVSVSPESVKDTSKEEVAVEDKERLTLKQEMFCQLYVKNSNLFGQGTLAYAIAYGHDLEQASKELRKDDKGNEIRGTSKYDLLYAVCATGSSRTLRIAKVNDRVTELLNEMLDDKNVDAQLAKVILQDYKIDAKVRAITEYNKLKARITEKIDHTTLGKELPGVLILPRRDEQTKDTLAADTQAGGSVS